MMQFTKRTILGNTKVTLTRDWCTALFPAIKLPYENIKTGDSSQFSDGSLRIDTPECVVLIDRFDCHAPANATIYRPAGSANRMAVGQFRLPTDQYEDIISYVKGRYCRCCGEDRFPEMFKAFAKRKRETKNRIIRIVEDAKRVVVAQAEAEAVRLEEMKARF